MNNLPQIINNLVSTFGPVLAALLLVALLGALLLLAQRLLFYGHEGFRTLLPLFREVLKLLRSEYSSPHVPLRIESAMHIFLVITFVVPVAFLFGEAVIPWARHADEVPFIVLMVSSPVLFFIVCGVSWKYYWRLK